MATTTKAAPKLKVCSRQIHNGVERIKCDTPYVTDECPKVTQHVLKIKTGFCGMGFCEGMKPRSFRGTPQKTCEFWQTCACTCHAQLDEMFKSISEPRIVIENAEYVPDLIEFNIEDYINLPRDGGSLASGGTDGNNDGEYGVPAKVPANPATLAVRRTETGRAARGGLEAQVFETCKMFSEAGMDGLLTPKIVADSISDKYKIPTPSTGAIGAVWDRWEKIGFAKQSKKPVRFMGFETKATWDQLLIIKGKAKREKKVARSQQIRGMR